jgi:MoaA/NifB/PqqE/SkfB family radical SAM enzyme
MSTLSFEEYRTLWDIVARKPFLTGFPLHLDVELTSRCNLRCEMCFQRHMKGRRVDMTEGVFRKIVDEGASEGLCAMKLQSRGEPLLHPKVVPFLEYAKKKGILDVHITTNGLLLTDDLLKGLTGAGLDLLILSYDLEHCKSARMSEKEYTLFMQEAVRKADGYRRKDRKSRMKIRIQTCVTDYTPENIAKAEKENKALFPRADFILINPMYMSYEEDPHLSHLDDYEFYPCSYLWQRLTIYADGSVTTCSRDYNCKFNRIGTVLISSIRELWHSPAMRDLRHRQLQGRRKEFHICALCENYLIHKKTGMPGAGCTGIVYDMKKA